MEQKQNRYDRMLEAIELERAHEEKYYQSLSTQKTVAERIESGLCWSPCDVIKSYYTIGEQAEVQFERRHRKTNKHKLKNGAGCIVYRVGEEEKKYSGVISFVRKDKIRIIFGSDEILRDHELLNHSIHIEQTYDERSYKVMRHAIQTLVKCSDENIKYIKRGIDQKKELAETFTDRYIPDLSQMSLNESQQEALRKSISAQYLSIIHGPPGTGKTTTLVQLVKLLLKYEKRILVCAPSNNATDLLAQRISELNIEVVRVGNVSRMSDETAHLSLANKAANSDDWQQIKKVKISAEEAFRKAKKYKRNFGEQERRERRMMMQESRELKKWAKDLEQRLLDKILSESQVVCTTLISAANREIQDLHFDTLVIDEASQALEAECWNAMLKCKRVILAGDHQQLPPTIMSKAAQELDFGITILDRMSDTAKHVTMLDTQYRMHELILGFSNQEFYDGKLKSDQYVKERTLSEGDQVVTFIDTVGAGFEESIHPDTLSKWNEGEWFILREHFLQHKSKYTDKQIGVISPYSAQVKYLMTNIETDDEFRAFDIEVNSIDGFQGQEKDVVYISLVRSNDNGEIGFLQDYRRLNVAMTRAKSKLIIIGDSATISQHKLFMDMINYVESFGHYESAYQYMHIG